MSKHTPGPWRMEHNGNDGARVNAFATVAWCPTSAAFGVDGSQVISADEAKANARLIAAAPDLLAACIQATISLRAIYGLLPHETCSEVMLLDAAIAKAKGEKA